MKKALIAVLSSQKTQLQREGDSDESNNTRIRAIGSFCQAEGAGNPIASASFWQRLERPEGTFGGSDWTVA
jgi:hypothetical protein